MLTVNVSALMVFFSFASKTECILFEINMINCYLIRITAFRQIFGTTSGCIGRQLSSKLLAEQKEETNSVAL